jgi:hypothetical protein
VKTIVLQLFTIFTIITCNAQVADSSNSSFENKYQVHSEKVFSLGFNNRILSHREIQDGNYLLSIQVNDYGGIYNYKDFFVKINQEGDSAGAKRIISSNQFPSNYIECGNYYYGIKIDSRTMGGYSKDFLNKYDKNWNLIWTKNINKPKWPDGNTILTLLKNSRILVIANEFKSKNHQGISISKYDLKGTLISSKLLSGDVHCNPISILATKDNNYFLTADKYDDKTKANSLWMIKLNTDGDTIWSKVYPNFYPKQTILTSKNEIVVYGSNYASGEGNNKMCEFLKVLMLDNNCNLKWQREINKNWYERPGNMIETKDGHFLFSSSITPIKDNGEFAYLFELDSNGNKIYENKFDYSLGIQSTPIILQGIKQIIMVSQKWIGRFGEPFHDIISLITLDRKRE